jgi:hypothetical protein
MKGRKRSPSPPHRKTVSLGNRKPRQSSVISQAFPKKVKPKRRVRPPPPPAPIILPPHVRRRQNDDFPSDRICWLTDEHISAIALNIAREDSWSERKQHLMPLMNVFLSYQHLSTIIHRFPSFEERVRTTEMLKDRIRDSDHSFYIFVQSFALINERRTICNIFQFPFME